MPQLDPTWFASQLFWLAITFVLLYVLISRVLLPPIAKVMAKRRWRIESDIEAAERLKQEAEAARQEYEQALAQAREESRRLMDQVMEEHQAKAEKATADMQHTIVAKLAEAEKRIAEKRSALLTQLQPAANEMAELITQRMAGNA